MYDPRPLNLRIPKPDEQPALLVALQKEHEEQLRSDTSGNVMKYGSSCLLKLMSPSSSESSSASDVGDNSSNSDVEVDTVDVSTATAITPEEFYQRNVVLTVDESYSTGDRNTRSKQK